MPVKKATEERDPFTKKISLDQCLDEKTHMKETRVSMDDKGNWTVCKRCERV